MSTHHSTVSWTAGAIAALSTASVAGFALWLTKPICDPDDCKQTNGASAYDGTCREQVSDLFRKQPGEPQAGCDRCEGDGGRTKAIRAAVSELRPSAASTGQAGEGNRNGKNKPDERDPHFHSATIVKAGGVASLSGAGTA